MIATGRLLGLAVIWALMGLAVTLDASRRGWWWWALAGIGAVVLIDGVWVWWLSRKVEATRRYPRRVALGRWSEGVLEVMPRAGTRVWIEVQEEAPTAAEVPGLPWRGWVDAGRTAVIRHEVRMLERGRLVWGRVEVRFRTLLGLLVKVRRTGEPMEVRVFPDYEPVIRFALLSMEQRQDQMGIVRRSQSGSSRDFHQLREYREGDSLAQIDWKASSRRQMLVSREFQEQRNQSIFFLVDTGRRMRAMDGELPQFDHALNAMLLMSYVALRQGDCVGIQGFGGEDRWLPMVKGSHAMATILNHLYDYQTSQAPSDFSAAAEKFMMRQRRRALVVLVTNLRGEDHEELVPALSLLSSRHLVMLASLREASIEKVRSEPVEGFESALRYSAAEAYDRERMEILAALRGRGVLTLDVPAAELPIALANRYLDIKAAGRL